uniref:Peptidylglycine alpha-amidating monooxygenase n=1 Tax=Crocodylus porosus TaxID=8502 RepID=A0A7M4ECC9_CROPO
MLCFLSFCLSVDFKPHASMDTVHHMLLFGCNMPSSTENYWDCDEGTCTDDSNILYAWARNAPPTKLPSGVGFKVGGKTGSKYFVLQVHYGDISAFRESTGLSTEADRNYLNDTSMMEAYQYIKDNHKDCSGVTLHLTHQKQPLIAGMYLMMSVTTVIPPGEKVVDADIACHYKRYPMHLFAYRVHTHRLGKVVSGYRVRDGQWTLIGRQSPQLPQAFYPVEQPVDVSFGDILAARCVFSGEGRVTETRIGGTASDEMCNFYIMYYMEAKHAVSYMTCTQNVNPEMFRNIPQEANIPISVKPDMIMMTHGHHEENKNAAKSSLLQQPKREEEEVLDGDFHIEEVVDWPGINIKLGQVSGLALDPEYNLVIFHRGDHVWDENSFDSRFVYQQRGLGPIEQNTILVIDPSNAAVLHSTGKNLFYLPHGLSIDKDGYYWVTDVALHQVFKLGAHDKAPLLTLGMALQPGNDKNHFCQPTDVAVDPITGTIYVSDGYCNSRIVQFSPNGMFIMQWGEETSSGTPKSGQFLIPHSLALIPDFAQLCVADRENGRIQCFRLETGEFTKEIKHKSFGRELFAVSYVPGGLLFAVNGKSYPGDVEPVQGFVMNFSTGEIIDTFVPVRKNFEMPHDIVASEDKTVYVGDAHARTVWKFVSSEKMEHRSVKKAGIEVQEIKEAETIVEARLKNNPVSSDALKKQEKQHLVQQANTGVSFVLITTLLIIPIVVLLAIAVFIWWRKTMVYGADADHKLDSGSGRILGRFRGKGTGGLNLGNFFASRKGYSRKGFDRLSTEGSDQEKDEDDGTDSEEEYSAPPPPPVTSSS